jgi:hypothetical protein
MTFGFFELFVAIIFFFLFLVGLAMFVGMIKMILHKGNIGGRRW